MSGQRLIQVFIVNNFVVQKLIPIIAYACWQACPFVQRHSQPLV